MTMKIMKMLSLYISGISQGFSVKTQKYQTIFIFDACIQQKGEKYKEWRVTYPSTPYKKCQNWLWPMECLKMLTVHNLSIVGAAYMSQKTDSLQKTDTFIRYC